MADTFSDERAKLAKALKALRAIVGRGPERHFTYIVGKDQQGNDRRAPTGAYYADPETYKAINDAYGALPQMDQEAWLSRNLRGQISNLLQDIQRESTLPLDADLLTRLDAAAAAVRGKAARDAAEPPPDQEREVYGYIRDHGPATAKEIVNHFGRKPKSFDRVLRALRDRGLIKNRRGAGYYIPKCRRNNVGMT